MFNSTGNNFGAGVIQFKDVQESNYIVLNAKFTCSPQSAEYQAAEVLEIYVPALSIARSTIAGVVARYKERGTSYGYPYIYDGGTVLKSWVKDANTLCIEKLAASMTSRKSSSTSRRSTVCWARAGTPPRVRRNASRLHRKTMRSVSALPTPSASYSRNGSSTT